MPFGARDFGNVQKTFLLQRLDDMAELAVRIGGQYVFDRLGEVIWYTSFSEPLQSFNIQKPHPGVRVYLNPYYGYLTPPALSIYVPAGTTGDTFVIKNLPFYNFNVFGISGIMYFGSENTRAHIAYVIQYDTIKYWIGVELWRFEDILVIRPFGRDEMTIQVPSFWLYSYVPHFVKVVADFKNKSLVRLIFDAITKRIDAPIPSTVMSYSGTYSYIEIGATPSDVASIEYRFDNIILTVNEPI